MGVVIIIIFIALIIFIITILNRYRKNKKLLLNTFKNGSVIVFGKKGKGKDLLFQFIIANRKQEYFSNVDYGGSYNYIAMKDIDCGNSYRNFIENNIKKTDKIENREGKDLYLSDCGIILPAQYDSALHKMYPSFSVYYALSRHLYNSNIHANTQSLERIWKALREQADYYVKCRGVRRLFGLFIVSFTYYDKYSSAKIELEPMKLPFFANKEMKARKVQYDATNGEIINGFFLINKKSIKYDTRVFEKVMFN